MLPLGLACDARLFASEPNISVQDKGKPSSILVAKLLLEAGASPRAYDAAENNCLHYAISGAQLSLVRLFCEHARDTRCVD
jgi:ankyrin repeat protein